MPRSRTSDDVDHVIPDLKPSNAAKTRPPEPWPLPDYEPMHIKQPFRTGVHNLPAHVSVDNPYAIFSLFFDHSILKTLAKHTNKYAELHPSDAAKFPKHRPWTPITWKELRAYITAYIWMGLYKDIAVDEFWKGQHRGESLHPELRHIGRERWQQIDRFFHISDPEKDEGQVPFKKLEPLNDRLRRRFKKYWIPGTHLAVDESIQRFMGRSSEIVNIPSKPTPDGFKVWLLGNQGYILDWMWHAKGEKYGPYDLDDFWTEDLGFSKTQAVVFDLVKQQGISDKAMHIIWMDNLFTSAKLLAQLKQEGFGAAGTVRTTKTAREEVEEKHGTKRQKQLKEVDRGLDRTLSDLKLKHGGQLTWGQLFGQLSKDGEVTELAWKDQNVVLFMTTVATGKESVLVERRRPAATAPNARTSRTIFGDEVTKDLWIPQFIDAYNHFMNGVDIADQLRSYYNTQKTHRKNWKPLWHLLLDAAVVNSFIIYASNPEQPWGINRRNHLHREFRRELVIGLFDNSECEFRPIRRNKALTEYVHPAQKQEHQLIRLTDKAAPYKACVSAGRKATQHATQRKPLGELSTNTTKRVKLLPKRPERPPRSRFGCALCNINLCEHKRCWSDHIRAIQ